MKNFLKNILLNIPGSSVKSKILIIESDDWGTIRTPNQGFLNLLTSKGINVDKCHYTKFDSLETNEDLELLFNALVSVKNSEGKHPVITGNVLMANPDFERIKHDDFRNYYFENVSETFRRNENSSKVIDYWKKGLDNEIFFPQLHGREHVNISRWMNYLQNKDSEMLEFFDWNSFGISHHLLKSKKPSFLAAFDGGLNELTYNRAKIIDDAFSLFFETFGFRSKSFICPNYIWDKEIELALKNNGINYIQGSRMQVVSNDYGIVKEKKRHFHGEKNDFNQEYLIRNVEFEPSSDAKLNWVDRTFSEIQAAFLLSKPAIISAHRVNFVGSLDKKNRDSNLIQLELLLKKVVSKWPEVKFYNTAQYINELEKK